MANPGTALAEDLEDRFPDLSRRAETFTLTYRVGEGWSAPFPDVDGENTLVLVFAASMTWHEQAPLEELRSAFPNSIIAGSGASETVHGGELLADVISVGITRFHSTEPVLAVAELAESSGSREAGRTIGRALEIPALKGILLFSKGLHVEATELVAGIQDILPAGIPIAGGLASDRELANCWVYAGGELRNDAVCAVGLVGERVELVCSSGGGWLPSSDRHLVTKAVDKRIYEIDGRPAYDVLSEQLARNIDENPWAIANETIALKLDGADLVRSILGSDAEDGYLEVAGDVPEGIEIQFMQSTIEEILDGVDEAAHGIRMKTVGLTDNALCVVIGCMGRVSILGDRTSEEVRSLRSSIGEGVSQVGMYSLGEILTTTCGHPQVHNLTMAVAVIREH